MFRFYMITWLMNQIVDAAEAAGVKGYLFTGTNLLDFIKTIIQLIITITLFYASLMSVLR